MLSTHRRGSDEKSWVSSQAQESYACIDDAVDHRPCHRASIGGCHGRFDPGRLASDQCSTELLQVCDERWEDVRPRAAEFKYLSFRRRTECRGRQDAPRTLDVLLADQQPDGRPRGHGDARLLSGLCVVGQEHGDPGLFKPTLHDLGLHAVRVRIEDDERRVHATNLLRRFGHFVTRIFGRVTPGRARRRRPRSGRPTPPPRPSSSGSRSPRTRGCIVLRGAAGP